MSKLNWGTIATRTNYLILWIGVLLAACSAEPTPVAEPTQSLIQATATVTPSPVAPTFTPSSALAAPDQVGNTTVSVSPAPSTIEAQAEDQVAIELAALAQRRIAREQGIAVTQVEVVEARAYAWQDTSLGCPVPGQTYTPLTVDGYRIVLQVGDEQFIFHTDFDRAIPCDPELELLPEN